jgi:hypothetical protein
MTKEERGGRSRKGALWWVHRREEMGWGWVDASVEVRAVITCTPSTRWLKGRNPHPRAQAGTKMRLARWTQEKEEEKRVIEQHKQFLKDVAKGR